MNSLESCPTSTSDFDRALSWIGEAGLRFHYLMHLPEGEWWIVAYKHEAEMQQMFHGKAPTILIAAQIVVDNWKRFHDIYGWPPVRPVPTRFTKSSPLELDIKI